jgi:hypothetical protein
MIVNDNYPYIKVTGFIIGTTLTVSTIANGPIVPPMMVGGLNVPMNLMITAQLTGYTGGIGTYMVSQTCTVAAGTMLIAPWTLNVSETILAQCANSPILLAMANLMNSAIDMKANLFNWYNLVWNVNSAQGYGLDMWARIVGVPRVILTTATNSYLYFKEANLTMMTVPPVSPFGPGGASPLYNGGTVSTSSYSRLADSSLRALILVKALANISICSAQSLNVMLQMLFGVGSGHVIDIGNMQMVLSFQSLSSTNLNLIINGKALPRPAGVLAIVYSGSVLGVTFAFKESGAGSAPFGYGSIGPSYTGGEFFNGLLAAISY